MTSIHNQPDRAKQRASLADGRVSTPVPIWVILVVWAGCSQTNEVGVLTFSPDGGQLDLVAETATGDLPSDAVALACEIAADGGCAPLTPDTSCVPLVGQRYDEGAACVSALRTTLYCAAFPSGATTPFAPSPGCFSASSVGMGQTFWTAESDPKSSAEHACSVDTARLVADAAPCTSAGLDAGASTGCQMEADGTCHPTTSGTRCTPFTGRIYDRAAHCISSTETTLYCAAFADGVPGGFASAASCYRIGPDDEQVIYWTPNTDPGRAQATGHACDSDSAATVLRAPTCEAL